MDSAASSVRFSSLRTQLGQGRGLRTAIREVTSLMSQFSCYPFRRFRTAVGQGTPLESIFHADFLLTFRHIDMLIHFDLFHCHVGPMCHMDKSTSVSFFPSN
jgi:hypothetical protein